MNFPFLETKAFDLSTTDLLQKSTEIYQTSIDLINQLPQFTHGFTRYKVFLNPYLIQVSEQKNYAHCEWFSLKELNKQPFSSGHRRILHYLNTLLT